MIIISLGAGVQSSVMSLKAASGEFQDLNGQVIKADCAIFADTQAEPQSVYEWLDWLELEIDRLPFAFPIYRVTEGDLWQAELRIRRSKKSGKLYLKNSIPAFLKKPDGKIGLAGRKCTPDFKIIPIQRKVKELMELKRAPRTCNNPAEVWIGISTDEAHRMKESRVNYIKNTWPLIDVGMSRQDCLIWMKEKGYPEPPRSACIFCPFHSDYEWNRMKTNEPKEWERAIQFEKELQGAASKQEVLLGVPFLHESCVPLESVVFKSKDPRSGWGNECEGLCGV